MLFLNFNSFVIQYPPRICNRVADALAALGVMGNMEDDPMLDILPPCIELYVASDQSAYD